MQKTLEINIDGYKIPLENGDIETLPNGKKIRLIMSPDYGTNINDFDYLGKVEWVSNHGGIRGYRPKNFDGSAEIVKRDGNANLWWSPPKDVRIGSDIFRTIRKQALDVIEYGYYVYKLELLDGLDAYERPIVTKVAALGGIEPFLENDDKIDILTGLYEGITND